MSSPTEERIISIPPPSVTGWVTYAIQSVGNAFGTLAGFVYYNLLPGHNSDYDRNRISEAIVKLQRNLVFLDGKIESMGLNCERYSNAARMLYRSHNKSAAVHQIRLKKMYEREIRKMESLKFNIESNILHIESVGVMMETVCTIKETSDHFQIIQRHVDISKLENTIEEMCDQRDASHDIESIMNDMHNAEKYEDDELLQELEDLVNDKTTEDEAETSSSFSSNATPGILPAPPPSNPLIAALASIPTVPTTNVLHPPPPPPAAAAAAIAEPVVHAVALTH
jgi:charged multivesicular body protein 4